MPSPSAARSGKLNRLVGPAVAGMLIYLVGIGADLFFLFLRFARPPCACGSASVSSRSRTAASAGGVLAAYGRGPQFHPQNEIYYILSA